MMLPSAATTNVQDFFQSKLLDRLTDLRDDLVTHGDLREIERGIRDICAALADEVCREVITSAAEVIAKQTRPPAGFHREKRTYGFRLASGCRISVDSVYYRRVPAGFEGCRHPLVDRWKIIGGASPLLYDLTAYFSSICPSYETANQALAKMGVRICPSSTKDITNALAEYVHERGEVNFALDPNMDDLTGKRVAIGVDGGRTRVRKYGSKLTDKGNPTYKTHWKEPKLFVIGVLNEDGTMDKSFMPPYGCRFGVEDCVELLGDYLKAMNIAAAECVQVVADGAPWIWQRVTELLERLGVEESRLTRTLDYYHAMKYVNTLVERMPKRVGKRLREELTKEFKELLWQGNGERIVARCKEFYTRVSKKVRTCFNYLSNDPKRMQYEQFREANLLCGSGIVESGVRRLINLRFKNTSSFWHQETVEKLYFLRGSVLSGRWETVMRNIRLVN